MQVTSVKHYIVTGWNDDASYGDHLDFTDKEQRYKGNGVQN